MDNCLTRSVTTEAERAAIETAAGNDNHNGILAPTHVRERDGQIIAAASIGGVALAHAWFHTQLRARDTFNAFKSFEQTAFDAGYLQLLVPCERLSPLRAAMQHFGYAAAVGLNTPDKFEWWFKKLR